MTSECFENAAAAAVALRSSPFIQRQRRVRSGRKFGRSGQGEGQKKELTRRLSDVLADVRELEVEACRLQSRAGVDGQALPALLRASVLRLQSRSHSHLLQLAWAKVGQMRQRLLVRPASLLIKRGEELLLETQRGEGRLDIAAVQLARDQRNLGGASCGADR